MAKKYGVVDGFGMTYWVDSLEQAEAWLDYKFPRHMDHRNDGVGIIEVEEA